MLILDFDEIDVLPWLFISGHPLFASRSRILFAAHLVHNPPIVPELPQAPIPTFPRSEHLSGWIARPQKTQRITCKDGQTEGMIGMIGMI
jgi:hypothetical protein